MKIRIHQSTLRIPLAGSLRLLLAYAAHRRRSRMTTNHNIYLGRKKF